MTPRSLLVIGLGVTGRAVARASTARGLQVALVDDRPGDAARACAAELGLPLDEAPGAQRLAALIDGADGVVVSPGVPERHPVFALAAAASVPLVGELDLASQWDRRPCLAITGTDGKTTVTTMVTRMLNESGVAAVDAGNTEVPLVEAIDDPGPRVFVVEASSFRLAPLRSFRPAVGTWLNLAPDHQDVHADLAAYEAAKANIWGRATVEDLAVGSADDPVVLAHLRATPRSEAFGLGTGADVPEWHVADGELRGPQGLRLLPVADLPRQFPHDITNSLAAAATALGGGASVDGVRSVLRSFSGLPHRVALVGEAEGVRWYDDSKATAPHATLAALEAFDSVVLIAGGRNKGLDLSALARAVPRVRAVVAIGEAAPEVAAAFDGTRPVRTASSMDEAVVEARALAHGGDVVLLSPGCASFDWYGSYAERGDDFCRAVHDLIDLVP